MVQRSEEADILSSLKCPQIDSRVEQCRKEHTVAETGCAHELRVRVVETMLCHVVYRSAVYSHHKPKILRHTSAALDSDKDGVKR